MLELLDANELDTERASFASRDGSYRDTYVDKDPSLKKFANSMTFMTKDDALWVWPASWAIY